MTMMIIKIIYHLMVNINLCNTKLYQAETVQSPIYSHTDSQSTRPITRGARVKGNDIQSQDNRKDRTKNTKQRKNITININ
jgi:hypothetical protein